MASWVARCAFFFIVCCFVASLCEARGGRGGGRYGSRSSRRWRGRGGGGGVPVGMIFTYIFASIGGILFVAFVYIMCKIYVCTEFPDDSAKDTDSNNAPAATTTTTPPHDGVATTTPTAPPPCGVATATATTPAITLDSPYRGNDSTSQYDNYSLRGDLPPSYESVVNQKQGALAPYSAQPYGDPAYPPASACISYHRQEDPPARGYV